MGIDAAENIYIFDMQRKQAGHRRPATLQKTTDERDSKLVQIHVPQDPEASTYKAIYVLGAIGPGARGSSAQADATSYQRVLPDLGCPVGERTGYIFQSGTIDALVKIGTP